MDKNQAVPHVAIVCVVVFSLCTYLEHLEEGRLSGVAASGAGGHHNVDGRDGAHAGRGGHAVRLDHVADVPELAVGEDEPHVSHHPGEELRKGKGKRVRPKFVRFDIVTFQ